MTKASANSKRQPIRKTFVMPIHDEPGHLIRRAQQLAVARFHEIHGRHATPIQYAILPTLQESPGIELVAQGVLKNLGPAERDGFRRLLRKLLQIDS